MIQRSLLRLVLGLGLLAGLSACNTLEGLGKDIKSAGQSIENAADRRK